MKFKLIRVKLHVRLAPLREHPNVRHKLHAAPGVRPLHTSFFLCQVLSRSDMVKVSRRSMVFTPR